MPFWVTLGWCVNDLSRVIAGAEPGQAYNLLCLYSIVSVQELTLKPNCSHYQIFKAF